ncbi:hypothetical protein [Companilactobacillus furfuricola]|uniref:hypothetical protein n=1 Tax=Companilactobacillus furfuricola TaxID=1462575 RepID=UPI000F7976C5|nr:hypothetical protein [Companilactobacillus furfuricola]
MKKILFASAIALTFGLFTPALTSQAATTADQSTQPDYITEITTNKVNHDNFTTSFNTITVKDTAVPVYEIDNGAIKKTARKALPNTNWTSTTLVKTKSNGLFYQVSDNAYISADAEFVIIGTTMPLFIQTQD